MSDERMREFLALENDKGELWENNGGLIIGDDFFLSTIFVAPEDVPTPSWRVFTIFCL